MKNPLRTGLIALVASAALVGLRPAEGRQSAVQPDPVISAERFNITVDFDGGTVQEYVEAMQKAAGKMPVNVVIPAEARKVVLPAVSLRNVNVYTALSAISSAFDSNSEHRFDVAPIGNPADATYAIVYGRHEFSAFRNKGPTMQPGMMQSGMRMAPQQPVEKRLEVYSIRDLIDPPGADGAEGPRVKFEDILSAIEGAMQLLETEDKPRLLFHKETGLLMVGGTEYQTQVVSSLLSRIRDDLAQRWTEERTRKQASAVTERNLQTARTDLRLAELEMTQAEDRLRRVEQMVQQGAASSDAQATATLEYEKAKAKAQRVQFNLQAIEEQSGGDGAMVVETHDLSSILSRAPGFAKEFEDRVTELGATVEPMGGDKFLVRGTAAQLARVSDVLKGAKLPNKQKE